jgi:putative chitinase
MLGLPACRTLRFSSNEDFIKLNNDTSSPVPGDSYPAVPNDPEDTADQASAGIPWDLALQAVAPHLSAADRPDWVGILSGRAGAAGLSNPRRAAAFLGQCAFESGGLQCLEENLNYSSARLREVWPAHFPRLATAGACAFQPIKLANTVYANRLGNGDAASGDGWRFRGRGLIQITGRDAYERFAQAMDMTLDQAVAHACTRAGAADSALWFWSDNHLNELADTWQLDLMTRRINGGVEGIADRIRLCQAALHVLGG